MGSDCAVPTCPAPGRPYACGPRCDEHAPTPRPPIPPLDSSMYALMDRARALRGEPPVYRGKARQ